ncbi:unnamed protein product [Ambrosiozyma monospora]|uniref:Unnamed protein product n=1 Tax=Ambrosiozyma monospora TaxID=43982 RepID=A0ACB5U091_AMBMO|nr:unnamed protein product [Ambrosiozyma monospora]
MTAYSWAPLQSILLARVIKPFQLTKHTSPITPGDLIFIFEHELTTQTWVRGYLATLAMPSDFSSATVSIERLPESKVSLSIIPWSHLDVLGPIDNNSSPSTSIPVPATNSLTINPMNIKSRRVSTITTSTAPSTPYDTDRFSLSSANLNYINSINNNQSGTGITPSVVSNKPVPPPVPFQDYICSSSISLDSGFQGIVKEIALVLATINVHVYSLYTRGDYDNVSRLIAIFDELDFYRTNFEYGLLTRREIHQAKRQVAMLMASVGKIVGRSNEIFCQGSHFRFVDVSGYLAVLARDVNNGCELYASQDVVPRQPNDDGLKT